MNFAEFKDWAFLGLLGGGVTILYMLKASVDQLNIQIAIVIERMNNHEKRIDRLEGNK